ncbi:unnamed protein product [Pelagomonas calceolata]|uniref:Uncharacterized protein n=1 Tax=Pelagomonas calceolata TaxID=35677 RepID=A0A8J2SRK8_9STRA|nr:unnamed protein product [Pelagomonas calceolata]
MDTGTLTEGEKKAIKVALATAILRGANSNEDEDKPPRRDAIDAQLVAAREAAVLDAPAGSGDAVCQELALLARTRFAKSPQLLAAFLAASGVLAREAPASHAGALDAAVLRGTTAALSDLALDFAEGAAPARRAAAMRAAGPLIALFAELAAARLARAPEDGPGVAETTARLMRDLEPAPLAAALLADRFSCPLGAAA